MDDFNDIATLIKLQLKNLEGEEGRYRLAEPFQSEDFHLAKWGDNLHLRMKTRLEVSKCPTWLKRTRIDEMNTIEFVCDYQTYLPEILYLLCHCWREKELPSQSNIDEIFVNALAMLKKRWEGEGDPFTPEQQMGLIGELASICLLCNSGYTSAVDGWDSTGHALRDIQTEAWNVESKAKGATSMRVQISSFSQLEADGMVPTFLSVTDVSLNPKGETLPEFCRKVIDQIDSIDAIAAAQLRTKAETKGCLTKRLFRTKFKIGDTEIYDVPQGSSPDVMAKISLPIGVACGGYSMDLSELGASIYFETRT